MAAKRAFIAIIGIVVLVVAAFAVYAGITYPRILISIPVSFSLGADSKITELDQPFLSDKVQVHVAIENGAALWRAQILSDAEIVWEHSAAQSEQQSYDSDWIQLPSGNYNFTFGTIGIGSLEATVTVTSKGSFW
jgi:hypothetical protein